MACKPKDDYSSKNGYAAFRDAVTTQPTPEAAQPMGQIRTALHSAIDHAIYDLPSSSQYIELLRKAESAALAHPPIEGLREAWEDLKSRYSECPYCESGNWCHAPNEKDCPYARLETALEGK